MASSLNFTLFHFMCKLPPKRQLVHMKYCFKALNCNSPYTSRLVQLSRPLRITVQEREQRADRVQFLHFILAATGMKENHSPTFQPSMLLMFLCTHEREKNLSPTRSLWACVSQLFHKICKLAFFNLLVKLDQRK